MENKKSIVLYSEGYKPNSEITSFAQSLGYDNIRDLKCRMDNNFIKFIKNKIESNSKYNELIYIKNVDTNKKWCIMINGKRDFLYKKNIENIVYLNAYQQEQNFVKINLV